MTTKNPISDAEAFSIFRQILAFFVCLLGFVSLYYGWLDGGKMSNMQVASFLVLGYLSIITAKPVKYLVYITMLAMIVSALMRGVELSNPF